MGRRKLTTDQVEAYYREHPGGKALTPQTPWWIPAACIAGGIVIVLGLILVIAVG